jgi:hypothetical protein
MCDAKKNKGGRFLILTFECVPSVRQYVADNYVIIEILNLNRLFFFYPTIPIMARPRQTEEEMVCILGLYIKAAARIRRREKDRLNRLLEITAVQNQDDTERGEAESPNSRDTRLENQTPPQIYSHCRKYTRRKYRKQNPRSCPSSTYTQKIFCK